MTLPVRPPVQPMLAKSGEEIPHGDDWVYEPKWDGFRAIVFREGDSIHIASRKDRPLGRYFPEAESLLLDTLPDRCVVDGEIILASKDGLDFDALQLRLHPAASRVKKLSEETPVSFVVFDILALDDTDLCKVPLRERLDKLDELFGHTSPKNAHDPAVTPGSHFYLTPRTQDFDLATKWYDELEKVRLEGLIAKRLGLNYMPGDRVMMKIKHRRTCDCVIVGYRGNEKHGVASLLLGLFEDGELRYLGHTSSGSAAMRREMYELLQPLRNESPFSGEDDWGPGGGSRWSGGKDLPWVSVSPKLVAEISYDYVQAGYRFRHAARFLRLRDDKRPEECTFDQVRT